MRLTASSQMSQSESSNPQSLQQEALSFLEQFRTLLMATVSEDNRADCSYAPFWRDERGDLYIFVSELAQHTRNLLANPHASLLFIGNEADSKNLFARQRLTLEVHATRIPRKDPQWPDILNAMESHLGNTIALLKSLPDFHLIRFTVQQGNYVQGFAKAFALTGPELDIVKHRNS